MTGSHPEKEKVEKDSEDGDTGDESEDDTIDSDRWSSSENGSSGS